jgi:hypothetical protein
MQYETTKGASKNSELAQMPHKGMPFRYVHKQPVRKRQQGAWKILQRHIWNICEQKNFLSRSSWDEIWILGVP